MKNTAENHSVPSGQTAGIKQALTGRQQQVYPAQLLNEQQLRQSHATAAAQRTALAAIESMANTDQLQPSSSASGTNAAGASVGDAVATVAPTTINTHSYSQ